MHQPPSLLRVEAPLAEVASRMGRRLGKAGTSSLPQAALGTTFNMVGNPRQYRFTWKIWEIHLYTGHFALPAIAMPDYHTGFKATFAKFANSRVSRVGPSDVIYHLLGRGGCTHVIILMHLVVYSCGHGKSGDTWDSNVFFI